MRSVYRIEVLNQIFDARGEVRKNKLENAGFKGKINRLWLADVYTIENQFTSRQLNKIGSSLSNPVTQRAIILQKNNHNKPSFPGKFTFALEIGFLPGVTDNIANTAKEIIEDLLKIKFSNNYGVYSSQITFLEGDLSRKDVKNIALSLHNPLIQRAHIKSYSQYKKDDGFDFIVPKVKLAKEMEVLQIDLEIEDDKLQEIGKKGVANEDGTRRGPLALDLPFMKTIQAYFRKRKRKPTDIELEALAQTWSEHCKHTIFADPIDNIKRGLFKTYIKGATEEIRKERGKKDKCVSVFHDNSGAVVFDKNFLITHKVETHNSPSALDPFGGAITGIVGVNRDTIGFGLGAKPIANYYGFCFADPSVDKVLYKGPNFRQKMLSPRRIMDGVIEGVNAGGNQSGIPTPLGFLYFDERYQGKPLVFVGTVGLIPRKIDAHRSYLKKARPGDYIVMVGGRVGKDGIHGATFSSEAMDAGSPVTAVQIGDPITQKKLSDALVKEARDQLLYNSITDNGAGGLSCSVAEMAKESGGCSVMLEKVPLKYPGLSPWEIWISESQERMTLAVGKNKLKKFLSLMKKRDVEATVIGEFTSSGKCVVKYNDKTIMDIDLTFLHFGLPQRRMKTKVKETRYKEPDIPLKIDLTSEFVNMVGRLNLASYEFITTQYDYIVQSNLALSPLQGKARINANVSVIKPVLNSNKGAILSYGLYPTYSDIDTYHMAACAIDTAIRNIISAGGKLEEIYLLDNFCWCGGFDPFRLWQLKRAAQACYDYAKIYQTPFISGKDSMFNDFKGFNQAGNPIKISIPPTLLITSLGIVDDAAWAVSLDVKQPGDLIYILGQTYDELGGSEYFAMYSEQSKRRPALPAGRYIGNNVPQVDARKNKKLYRAFHDAVEKGLIASSISVGRGGLAVALARKAMGGMMGMDISLRNIPGKVTRDDFVLYSESQGRMIVTVAAEKRKGFEEIMKNNSFVMIGEVTCDKAIIIRGINGNIIVRTDVDKLLNAYRRTFEGF